ncbi:MAG: translational GTPase TypA [bacterium]
MKFSGIKNIAIIAHVDHGKTTLVDQLFKQSGLFRKNQTVAKRLMDSLDLERERGITITSKNGAFLYGGYKINIVDTPGHADFGGQVERVLNMVDGALLLVDAVEGPMPQTHFVLRKALLLNLRILVVINKIDRENARPDWVHEEVFELFDMCGAPGHLHDFPVIYASARDGYALNNTADPRENMEPLFNAIIEHIPSADYPEEGPLQLMISTLDYSKYLGRIGIGKITSGRIKVNEEMLLCRRNGKMNRIRITKIYSYHGNRQVETDTAEAGDIAAVAGIEDVTIGETITSIDKPIPLPPIQIDQPTISMEFTANDSPFSGRDGVFLTSTQLRSRLERAALADIAIQLEPVKTGYRVSGRGTLHLAILIETLRREGYELSVSSPSVITRIVDGKRHEPWELAFVEVPENYMGPVMEGIGMRRGEIIDMKQNHGVCTLDFRITTRGLLGFRSELMIRTRGTAVLYSSFFEFALMAGEVRRRFNGVMISGETLATVAYALNNLQERGTLFLGPGVNVYEGQVIGECNQPRDIVVNPAKGKKLSNVRASGSDDAVVLTAPREMTLEDCLEFMDNTELVEVTPKNIRIRKKTLKEINRRRQDR